MLDMDVAHQVTAEEAVRSEAVLYSIASLTEEAANLDTSLTEEVSEEVLYTIIRSR